MEKFSDLKGITKTLLNGDLEKLKVEHNTSKKREITRGKTTAYEEVLSEANRELKNIAKLLSNDAVSASDAISAYRKGPHADK